MRFISTRVHGILDYSIGLLLIALPWVLGIANSGAPAAMLFGLGFATIIYSLFTDYELGMVRVFSMKAHLWLDFTSGVLVALSPWLFNFAGLIFVPHLLLGLCQIAASLTTRLYPSRGHETLNAGRARPIPAAVRAHKPNH